MTLAIVLLCIAGLVGLIAACKINAFAAFLLTALAVVALVGQPSVAILLAAAYATYLVGLRLGKTMPQLMGRYAEAVKDSSMIWLIIGASGALRQVRPDSGVSAEVAGLLQNVVLLLLRTHPNLMVLAVGAGSLLFSHVNDSGFWLFKEYFNLSVKDTLRSWSVMGLMGLDGTLLRNQLVST